MKNNTKIASIFSLTLTGLLLVSPLNYVKAENEINSTTEIANKEQIVITKWVEILEKETEEKDAKDKKSAVEKDTKPKTEEEKKKEEEERLKPKEKELKPAVEGKEAEEAGEIEGYEFVKTDESEPGIVKHIFKKKDVTTKWEDTEGNELKKPVEGKEEKDHGTIEGYKYDRTISKDGKIITHIFKKETSTSSADDKKEDVTTTEAGNKTTTKSDTKSESTDATTKSVVKPESSTTTQTTEVTVVTTSTGKDGEQAPIITTETTVGSTTKEGSKEKQPEEPKYRSIFINKATGAHIVDGREGKEKISIDGYEFINTIEGQKGVFVHYYKVKDSNKNSKDNNQNNEKTFTTVWQDVHSGKQLLPTKEGKQVAGTISGYTFVKTSAFDSTGTVIHYFKKVNEEKTPKNDHHWSYHVDIDTGELIYHDLYRNDWRYPISINGYAYVDTDSWTDKNGISYHTHYYQRVSRSVAQVDPSKVFTVWVDEYYNQILPSKMGAYEAGELEGYEFDRTISVNDGYGIAHVFKKVDGEDRLAGKDTDKSMSYRVKSLLPRTSATGGTNYLPLVATGAGVGAIVGASVYFVMRRKNNN